MKTIATLLFLVMAGSASWAQTSITGKVLDPKGKPVIGANIFLKNTYDGASSDTAGNFSFATAATGNQTLIITLIGFKKQEIPILISASGLKNLNLQLAEERNELNAVMITAGAFEAGDEKRTSIMKSLDIVTTAGATGDISGALNTLPGAQKVGEEGKLFVRGGDSYETQTYIDGLMVQNPYNSSVPNLPSRGRFSPFLFSGTVFSSGGYSAEFGQALSSALILNTNDFPVEEVTGISLMAIGGSLSHTQKSEKTSVSVTGEYTNLAPLFAAIKQRTNWDVAPRSLGGSAVIRHKTSNTGLLKIYSTYNKAHFALTEPSLDFPQQKNNIDLRNGNFYLNSSYREILNPKWTLKSGVAFSRDVENIDVTAVNVDKTETTLQARTVLSHQLTDDIWLKFGGEHQAKTYDQDYSEKETSTHLKGEFDENYSAGFAEADIYLTNKLIFRPGVRLDYSALLQQAALAPRLSVAYKTGANSQISGAYGGFYQSPVNDYLKINKNLKLEEAQHFILNYQIMEENRTFRVEGYYKNYDNLIKYNLAAPYNPNSYTNTGNGFAKGIEIFWRDQKTVKRGDYWVSYSYLDTERNYKHYTEAAVPTFASKHNLSVVYKHFFPKLRTFAGTTFSYASGRPYHNPNLAGINQGRTPAYRDLSLNLSYLANIKGNQTILYISCTNLLGFNNTFGYRYSSIAATDGQFQSQRITQPAKRFAFIGLFISLNHSKK